MLKLSNRQFNKLFTPELIFIFEKILSRNASIRLVGGCVRDILLNHPIKDIDLATSMPPNEVISLFNDNKVYCIPTGLKHGTVTLVVNDSTFEITTLRKDLKCFGRHADVQFTDDWEEDAKRRDFTINAMSIDFTGKIYDYFAGYADIKNKKVKFVGESVKRIEEDYLRALRYFRFISYLGTENLDSKSFNTAIKYIPKLFEISPERIRLEMKKILTYKYAKNVIKIFIKNNCLKYVGLSEICSDQLEKLRFSKDFIINSAALLLINTKPISLDNINFVSSAWRLSNKEKTLLKNLSFPKIQISFKNPIKDIQERYLYLLGREFYKDLLKLKYVLGERLDFKILLSIAKNFNVRTLPIDGNDIKNLGFEGESIGKLLRISEKYWIDNDFFPKKEDLIKFIKSEK